MPTALITGGAGFLGSHLCERLLNEGWKVICVDSLITGASGNLESIEDAENFRFENHDVTRSLKVDDDLDWVMHLASPASPPDYLRYPIETLKVGAFGTLNALQLAIEKKACFFITSTSEVYGDPLVHPQPESYWGNVNPIGPRSVYDESKRFAEALTMAHHRSHDLPVRIVRIFNTYGPRMRRDDGRAVPTFIDQSLHGQAITVHGDGSQTRSLCYVDDLIEGFWRFLHGDHIGPMNIGNPHEATILELAKLIAELANSSSETRFVERPVDDPEVRCPDISLAKSELGWEPRVPIREGLQRTIEFARVTWR